MLPNYQPTQGERLWPEILRRHLTYREYRSCPELSDYVSCFWTMRSQTPLPYPVQSRVVPDGCIDIIFDLEELARGGSGEICGLMQSPSESYITGKRNYIGIRFTPIGASALLSCPVVELTDTSVPLADVWGMDAGLLSVGIYQARNEAAQIATLQRFLETRLTNARALDRTLKGALQLIIRHRGTLQVKEIARELCISQRHLTRRFTELIGTGPKTFSSIVRFQNVLGFLNQGKSSGFAELACANGYFDQAHLVKEFKSFYGLPPGSVQMSDLYNTILDDPH